MEIKKCKYCKKKFSKGYKLSKTQWLSQLFCSKTCSAKSRPVNLDHMNKLIRMHVGVPLSFEHRQKIGNALRGLKRPPMTEEHKEKLRQCHLGKTDELSKSWKGDKVGYHGLHQWVQKKLGKPSECSQCRTKESYRFEWANISGDYKRDLTDWKRLCVRCHRIMDLERRKNWRRS